MSSKEYVLMKFNILSMALDPENGHRISDAYAYAWDSNVYPAFDDGSPWHRPFEHDFDVSKNMMDDLINFLGKAWDHGNGVAPSFYDLENHYSIRIHHSEWERYKLIRAMRYIALSPQRFDEKFFREMTKNAGAPAEANHFADPLDRDREIYFM